ncbi:alanine racemase [Paenibacillus ginsengarvi]|uniref:alanine racemase n=1 Tax=Paenibacillus ginsengarvi TaxID=400777 RepID=UPI0013155748|nr:alanine racemase [Paenibacillus ginsengarvi]
MIVCKPKADVWAEIHLDRLESNIHAIRRLLPPDCAFMAVLKADGYGHGLLETARSAIMAGADALAVGALKEALLLRGASIRGPILVLTPCSPNEVDIAAENGISLPVVSEEWLREAKHCKTTRLPLRIHLKIDSGMGRFGIRDDRELRRMLTMLKVDDLIVEGIYTHLATANQADDSFVQEQFRRFSGLCSILRKAGFPHAVVHCAGSAAALRFPELALDMVRVGASLFGIVPLDEGAEGPIGLRLAPTFSLHARILQVKQIRKGESIGYDRTYTATEEQWVATLPIGYAHGLSRRCSGMSALVDGQWANLIGNICMNQCMVKLPSYYPVGTRVTLLGENGGKSITIDRMAVQIGTISQEVLTSLGSRVPRMYVELMPYTGC